MFIQTIHCDTFQQTWVADPHIRKVLNSTYLSVLLKACVHYFSLFSKEQCSFWLFRTKYFEKKLTFSSFIFPLFHEHAFFHELSCTACLVKTSCFEKIIVCVIETMLVTLLLVQKNKAQREVNQQIKCKSRQNCNSVLKTYSNDLKKHLNTFQVVVLRKSSSKSAYCNSLNPWKLQFFLNQVVNLHILILWNLGKYFE